jgi:cell division protein FtsW (lipid II flippase)
VTSPWRYFDFWLLGAVVLATAFGTTMIRSAVAGNEELLPLINRQIYFALAGLVLIFVVAASTIAFGWRSTARSSS